MSEETKQVETPDFIRGQLDGLIEVAESIGDKITPHYHKFDMIWEMLEACNEDNMPDQIKRLDGQLKASGEKGLCEILAAAIGDLEVFVMLMSAYEVGRKKKLREIDPDNEFFTDQKETPTDQSSTQGQ